MLASVYEFYDKPINNGIPTKTIQDFKNYFLSGLTIDKFVSCQNGILPQLFEREKLENKFDNYKSSKYLKKISNDYLKQKLLNSFENFKNYILDDTEYIDYKYIWDLVCKPKNDGGVLFEEGINLLIFKNPNDDMTNKIEIICPANYYSTTFFNEEKNLIGLLRRRLL